jgi:long-chain acyl-CoA synthetase
VAAPMTIQEMILSVCDRPSLSSKTALCMAPVGGGGESLTYGELGAAIRRIATCLRRNGARAGDRAALCCENRPLWGAAYFGCLSAGCVCVPIDHGLGEHELREILSHSGASVLIHSDRTSATCEAAVEALEGDIRLLRVDDIGASNRTKASGQERTDRPAGASEKTESRGPDCEAVFIYTSGTMGRPKAVVLSHKNVLANVASLRKAVHLRQDDVFLSVLPLNHTLECTAGLLAPLSDGARVAYARSLRPRELGEALRAVRPTVMLGVPLLFEKLLAGLERAVSRAPAPKRAACRLLMGAAQAMAPVLGRAPAKVLLRGIRTEAGLDRARFLISGAAPMPAKVARGYRALGVTLIQGYGLTEASPVVAVNRPDAPRDDTVGVPLPGVEVKVDSAGGDGVGELLVKGDSVMIGYYRDPQETSRVLREGWLRTGDLGWIDKGYHVHISGRIKSVIVTSAGKNVYPEEIERLLLSSPFISEVIVVGRRSAAGNREQPHAIVYPDRDAVAAHLGRALGDLREDEVLDMIKSEMRRLCSRLADYKKIRGFSIRNEEFPKTSSKKIKRYLFQETEARL